MAKSKVTKRVSPEAKFIKTLDTTLKALSELYPQDFTRPGIVLADISKDRTVKTEAVYASLVRYDGTPGEASGGLRKQILSYGYGPTAQEALTKAITEWRKGSRNALSLLRGARLAEKVGVSARRRNAQPLSVRDHE